MLKVVVQSFRGFKQSIQWCTSGQKRRT